MMAESGGSGLKKGPWTGAEDSVLMDYVRAHGEGNWNAVQKQSGLNRCGKSCRLRWANHLRPNLKKGSFSPHEETLILDLHSKYGNKWARMATQLPGRTDNEIKNYWNTRVKRRKRQGLPLYPNDARFQQHMTGSSTTPTTPTSFPFQQQMTGSSTTPTTPTNFPFQQQMTGSLTTPTTPTNFPFQQKMNGSLTAPTTPTDFPFHQKMPFSFQYRPVPLLSVPPPGFSSSYSSPSLPTGSSSAASSHLPSPAAVTPDSQFLRQSSSSNSSSGVIILDDILENLTRRDCFVETGVKEEGVPQDFLNFDVAPPHWYNGALDVHQYFPSEAAATNYSNQNLMTLPYQ